MRELAESTCRHYPRSGLSFETKYQREGKRHVRCATVTLDSGGRNGSWFEEPRISFMRNDCKKATD